MYLLWHANLVCKSSKAPSFSLAISTRQWWEHLFTVARPNADATLRPFGTTSTSQVVSASTLYKDHQPKHTSRADKGVFCQIAEFLKLMGRGREGESSL